MHYSVAKGEAVLKNGNISVNLFQKQAPISEAYDLTVKDKERKIIRKFLEETFPVKSEFEKGFKTPHQPQVCKGL